MDGRHVDDFSVAVVVVVVVVVAFAESSHSACDCGRGHCPSFVRMSPRKCCRIHGNGTGVLEYEDGVAVGCGEHLYTWLSKPFPGRSPRCTTSVPPDEGR